MKLSIENTQGECVTETTLYRNTKLLKLYHKTPHICRYVCVSEGTKLNDWLYSRSEAIVDKNPEVKPTSLWFHVFRNE